MDIKQYLNYRMYFLILCIVLSIILINPHFNAEGVSIKNIASNSSAIFVGLQNPDPNIMPTEREIILEINDNKIKDKQDFIKFVDELKLNQTVRVTTNKKAYDPFIYNGDLGITISEVATSNLRKGLELQGGTRVLLKPIGTVTVQDIEDIKASISNRLDVYGVSDMKIKSSKDLSGNNYIAIEISGATKEEVRELVAQQGKFEAKIGNDTVFIGGKQDITYVCRNDGTCSGIKSCDPTQNGYACEFQFEIELSPEAAKKHAEITKNLDVNFSESGEEILSKPLGLYLDDKLVDTLVISADLKGKEATRIAISGPGFGTDQENAIEETGKNMNKLQTVLITGSLPFKLEIVKIDSISPTLGKAFVNNALTTCLIAMCAVALILYGRYRKLRIAIPILITMLSETLLTLGFAVIIKYNLDLAAIAGIVASVGTGVNDQIVITDEVLREGGVGEVNYNWKDRIKRAFSIIFTAYATIVFAMLPLLRAGAGLLTGFAFTTIVGVTIGVFITRPAFASVIGRLIEKN